MSAMQYIDKTTHLQANNGCTREYLVEALLPDGRTFYPSFSSKKEPYARFICGDRRKRLEEILRQEQDNLCCYCMRNIKNVEATLEHIIPQSLIDDNPQTRGMYTFYSSQATAIRRGVRLGPVFDRQYSEHPIGINRLTRMPHQVAYANLTASCKGLLDLDMNPGRACCCNGKRGNEKIIPLMLLPNVENKLVYTKNGRVVLLDVPDDLRDSTLKFLGLNHETLIEIRLLWCRFAARYATFPDIRDLDAAGRKTLLDTILGEEYNDDTSGTKKRKYRKYIENNLFWELLMQYSWFFGYYRRRYFANPASVPPATTHATSTDT